MRQVRNQWNRLQKIHGLGNVDGGGGAALDTAILAVAQSVGLLPFDALLRAAGVPACLEEAERQQELLAPDPCTAVQVGESGGRKTGGEHGRYTSTTTASP